MSATRHEAITKSVIAISGDYENIRGKLSYCSKLLKLRGKINRLHLYANQGTAGI